MKTGKMLRMPDLDKERWPDNHLFDKFGDKEHIGVHCDCLKMERFSPEIIARCYKKIEGEF